MAAQAEPSLLVDYAPVMLWQAGPDRVRSFFNQPWLDFTGRPLEAELGFGWIEGVHPEDRVRCEQAYLQGFTARVPFTVDFRLRRHDGAWRWLLELETADTDAIDAFAREHYGLAPEPNGGPGPPGG